MRKRKTPILHMNGPFVVEHSQQTYSLTMFCFFTVKKCRFFFFFIKWHTAELQNKPGMVIVNRTPNDARCIRQVKQNLCFTVFFVKCHGKLNGHATLPLLKIENRPFQNKQDAERILNVWFGAELHYSFWLFP